MRKRSDREKRYREVVFLVISLLLVISVLFLNKFVGFATFETTSQGDFDEGDYSLTFYNSSGFVQLNVSDGYYGGNYTSKVFDAGSSSSWDNISWGNVTYSVVGEGNDANTVLLIKSDTTNGSTTFVDSAAGNTSLHTFTANNVYHSTADAKFGASSIWLGGSSETLDVSDSADWDFGTGDFTIDYWYNLAVAENQLVFYVPNSTTHSIYFQVNTASLVYIKTGSSTYVSLTYAHPTSQWVHHALVRNGGDLKFYIDGESLYETTNNDPLNDHTKIELGYSAASAHGYIDEFRISKGVARWTGNFTPPTSEYLSSSVSTSLNLTVRSCDDSNCDTESWNETYTNSTSNDLTVDNNRYFQYRTNFETNDLSYSAELYNVSIGYTSLAGDNPTTISLVEPSDGNTTVDFSNVVFNCSAEDNDTLSSMSLYSDYNSTVFEFKNISGLSGSYDSYSFVIGSLYPSNKFVDGSYIWGCMVNDTNNNVGWSSNGTFASWGLGSYSNTKSDNENVSLDRGGDVDNIWNTTLKKRDNKNDIGYGVALDSDNNIYITGYSYWSSDSTYDIYVGKFDSSGVNIWNATLDGLQGSHDVGYGIVLDSDNNIYVTGSSRWSSSSTDDLYIGKFDNGGVNIWNATLNGLLNSSDVGYDIVLDSNNNIYVVGYSLWSAATGYDIYVGKFDSSGENVWNATICGLQNSNDIGYDLALDSDNNIYVTGYTRSNSAINDIYIGKFDNDGVNIWNATLDGLQGSYDMGEDIALDSDNNIYVTGESKWTNATYYDTYVGKFDNDGVNIWNSTLDGLQGSHDVGYGIVLDSSGNIYVTGYSYWSSSSTHDIYVGKFDSSGENVWNATIDGLQNGNDLGYNLALDSDNNPYVTGASLWNTGSTGYSIYIGKFSKSYSSSGNYTSKVFDAGSNVKWDNFSWIYTNTSSGPLDLQFRTSDDDVIWGGWNGSISNGQGMLDSNARYFQYQVNLSTDDISYTPYLQEVNINYSEVGLDVTPPTISNVTVYNKSEIAMDEDTAVVGGENITFNVTVTDVGGDVSSVWVVIWTTIKEAGNIMWEGFLSLIDATNNLWSVEIETNTSFGYLVNYTIYVNDSSNNTVSYDGNFSYDYTMYITLVEPSDGNTTVDFSNVTFNCSAEDNDTLSSMSLYSDYNASIFEFKNISGLSGSYDSYSFDMGNIYPSNKFVDTSYIWGCMVNDTSNNVGWSSNGTFASWGLGSYSNAKSDNENVTLNINSDWTNQSDGFSISITDFTHPEGITTNGSDDFWVVDRDGGEVYHFNSSGTNLSGGFISAEYGRDLVTNGSDFWVTDDVDNFVYHFDSQGNNLSGGFGTVDYPHGITTNGSDFWVADVVNNLIVHYNAQGNNLGDGFAYTTPSALTTNGSDFWIISGTFVYHMDGQGNNLSGGFGISDAGISDVRGIATNLVFPGDSFQSPSDFWIVDQTDKFVYHFEKDKYYSSGNYTSQVFDAGENVKWDNLSWVYENTSSGPLDMQFRTSNDNINWEGWNGTIENGMGEVNDSARYFQYQANFSTGDTSYTPYLQEVSINYVDITAPVISNVTVYNKSEIAMDEDTALVGGENITFNVTVSDASPGMSSVWLVIWDTVKDTGNIIWEGFLSLIGGDLWSVEIETNTSFSGLVNYTIYVNDTLNNTAFYDGNFSIFFYNFTYLKNESDTIAYGYEDGELNNTFYNNSIFAMQLDSGENNGTYLSEVFDAGENVKWDNFSWVGNTKCIQYTQTFYSGVGDGGIQHSGTTYSTVRSNESGNSFNLGFPEIGQRLFGSTYFIYRAFFPFDTSELGSEANVTSASFGIWGHVDSSEVDFNYGIVQTTQDSTSELVYTDYSKCGALSNPPLGADEKNTGTFSTTSYNTFALNSTGLSWINKTGWTKLGVRSAEDYVGSGSPPADYPNYEHISAKSSSVAGTANDPKLVITYIACGSSVIQFRTSNDNINWEGWNGTISNGQGIVNNSARYFQYQVNFSTIDVNLIPKLYNVYINYSSANIAPYWLDFPNNTINITEDIANQNISIGYQDYFMDEEDNQTPINSAIIDKNETDVSCAITTGDIECSPSNNFTGSFIITISGEDSQSSSAMTSFEVSVDNVNDNPWWDLIENRSVAITEDTANQNISVGYQDYFRDVEDDKDPTLTIIDDNETDVSCAMDTGDIECSPSNNFTGGFIVTINGTDSGYKSELLSFEINITSVDDAPWANGTLSNVSYDEDAGTLDDVISNPDLKANFSDVEEDGSPTTYELMKQSNESTSCYFDGSNNFDCSTVVNQSGMDNYTISLNDSSGSAIIFDWNITINSINDVPTGTGGLVNPNDTNYSSLPRLEWNNGTDADNDVIYYVLEISNYSDFSIIEYYNGSIEEEVATGDNITRLGEGSYYWRVLASDLIDNSSWSDVRYFTYDASGPSIEFINQTNETFDIVDVTRPIVSDQNLTINVNVTSLLTDISSVWITIWETIGETGIVIWEGFMNLVDSTGLWTVDIETNESFGYESNYTIFANDTLNNTATYDGSFFIIVNTTMHSNYSQYGVEYGDILTMYSYYNYSNSSIIQDGECNVTSSGIYSDMDYNAGNERYENTTFNSSDYSLGENTLNYKCSKENYLIKGIVDYLNISDTIKPLVEIVYPSNGSSNDSSVVNVDFITNDLHSVANCTLYLNGSENTTSSSITNDINVNNTFIVENLYEGLIEFNISCVDESNNRNMSDVWLNRFVNPLVDYTGDSGYLNKNSTWMSITLIEENLDSIIYAWNYSENYTYYGGTLSYNKTSLVDGNYSFIIYVNDSFGKEDNVNGEVTIDTTNPSSFSLTNPGDGNQSDDNTPLLEWEVSSDDNFDNYTIEIANDSGFSSDSINVTLNSSTNSFSDWESILNNATWHWRVSAWDKAGNNYTSSSYSFTVGIPSYAPSETITTTITTEGSGGGGGGGKKGSVGILDLIKVGPISMYLEDSIEVPVVLQNKGNLVLSDIELNAESNVGILKLTFDKDTIKILEPGKSETVNLIVESNGNEEDMGSYEIIIKGDVRSPSTTDQIKIYIDLIKFGFENKEEVIKQLQLIDTLFEENPVCLELNGLVEQAKEALKNKEYTKALSLITSASAGCRELTKEERKVITIKDYNKLIAIVGVNIITLLFVFYIMKRIRNKGKLKK